MKQQLTEYFEYIKTIYINEFRKYMTEETFNKINGFHDVIELDAEREFKIIQNDKITFNLDLETYIEENKLKDITSLNDLNDASKHYVQYLLDNEHNIYEIVKNQLLYQIIIYFTQNKDDVISLGTAKIICDKLVQKYKLPYEDIIPSKEKEIALFVKEIVSEDVLLKGIINKDSKEIEKNYNLYSENENYKSFTNQLNDKYANYKNKIEKIYLTDSLFEYEKLEYSKVKNIELIKNRKKDLNDDKLKRLSSIKMALLNINAHKILFNAMERAELENYIIEINKIISKLMQYGKTNLSNYIDEEYSKMLEIEEAAKNYANKIWSNYTTSLKNYKETREFNFIVSTELKNNEIKASLVTSEMLRNIKNVDLKYGYILELKDNAVQSVTSDKKTNTLNKSILSTPNMVINANVKANKLENELSINPKKVYATGIYCFVDDDYLNNSSYLKAVELSEEDNLPVIMINKNEYYFENKNKSRVA